MPGRPQGSIDFPNRPSAPTNRVNPFFPTPPSHDDFENAQTISGGRVVEKAVSLAWATAQADEPAHGGEAARKSVWYRWTAPSNGEVEIAVWSPDPLTVGVYRGVALTNLAPVEITLSGSNRVRFSSTAGETIAFAVNHTPAVPWLGSGNPFDLSLTQRGLHLAAPVTRVYRAGQSLRLRFETAEAGLNLSRLEVWAGTNSLGTLTNGPWELEWNAETNGFFQITAEGVTSDGKQIHSLPEMFQLRPRNDDFTNAFLLPEVIRRSSFAFSAAGGSLETGEPVYNDAATAPAASLWWKWTPSEAAETSIHPEEGKLFVFRGRTIESLIPVAEASPLRIIFTASGAVTVGGAQFTNVPGETYWFSLVSTNERASTWHISQRLHWLTSGTAGNVGYVSVPFQMRVGGAAVEGPQSITVRMRHWRVRPDGPGYDWMIISETNLTNGPDFDWSWMPEEPGEYEAAATGNYASGEPWASTLKIQVRVKNDRREFATEIPSDTLDASIRFRTDWATVELDEPNPVTNELRRTVWWKWAPAEDVKVLLHVSGTFGGLPLDVFAESNGALIRIAHNEGRTALPPLQGLVALEAKAGTNYFIRATDILPAWHITQLIPQQTAPTDRSNFILTMEGSSSSMQSLVALSTAMGTTNPDGAVEWRTFARVLLGDGSPATNFHYHAQFYGGKTLASVGPLGGQVTVFNPTPGLLPGAVSGWYATIPGVKAGEQFWIQLRAWDGLKGWNYESARANGGVTGRSPFLEVIAGSELLGPTILTNLSDVRVASMVRAFTPGELRIGLAGTRGERGLELIGPRGFLYSVETSANGTSWEPLLLLTNLTGSVPFQDSSADRPSASWYRTRLID